MLQRIANHACLVRLVTLCTLLMLWPIESRPAAIYKHVDKDGNVFFSDQQVDGGEPVNSAAIDDAEKRAKKFDEESAHSGSPASANRPGKNDDILDAGNLVRQAPIPLDPPKQKKNAAAKGPRPLVSRVEIITPEHNATLVNPAGLVWVELQSYPTNLSKSGLTAQLWFNGQLVQEGTRTLMSIRAPKKGTHFLMVRLVDEFGQAHIESKKTQLNVTDTR